MVERAAMLQLKCAILDQKILDGTFSEYDAKGLSGFFELIDAHTLRAGPRARRRIRRPDGRAPCSRRSATGRGQRGRMIVTPAAAIADPALLGQAFAGDSWATWRAVLKAA
jgi:hypothetical protein